MNVHGHIFQTFNDKSLGKRLSSLEEEARSKDARKRNVLLRLRFKIYVFCPQTALSRTRCVQPRSKQELFPSTTLTELFL